ncbi:MAG: hypothetical protein EBR90_02035 [Actinobacteria bacterium]|nr:hypothetical protein [Actinomycetota bacterium]
MSKQTETDRELLELAAKAAGYKFDEWHIKFTDGNNLFEWNPITEDGDALRLAVKLNIEISQGFDDAPTAYAGYFKKCNSPMHYACEQHAGDPLKATRRAIVRAAAEIGRNIN